jgi:hypothetical protein
MNSSRTEIMRRLRLGDVRRLLRSRWGPILPNDDAGREDLQELLLPISVGPHAELKMPKVVEIHAPWMRQDEAQQLIDRINRTPLCERKPTAKQLGKRQYVTNQDRERLRLWTIAPHDMTPEQVAEHRKAKARMRMRRLREKQGKPTRAQYLAEHSINRTKPWLAEGKSRAAWYRKRRETSPCAVKLLNAANTPVSRRKRPRHRSKRLSGSRKAEAEAQSHRAQNRYDRIIGNAEHEPLALSTTASYANGLVSR